MQLQQHASTNIKHKQKIRKHVDNFYTEKATEEYSQTDPPPSAKNEILSL